MAEIDNIVGHIQDCAIAAGAKFAPDFPPEQSAVYPFAVTWAARGSFMAQGAGYMKGLCTAITQIHKIGRAHV